MHLLQGSVFWNTFVHWNYFCVDPVHVVNASPYESIDIIIIPLAQKGADPMLLVVFCSKGDRPRFRWMPGV